MRQSIVLLLCFLLAGCVTTPPDPAVFNTAERAIEAAEAAGAEELSPTELRFARDRLQLARKTMDERDYDEAIIRIEESEINATLAIEKSRAALERRKVNELQRANAQLRNELVQTYGQEFEQ